MKYKTLILNSDYTPFGVVSWKTAFTKMYSSDVAYCVATYDKVIKDSAGRSYNLPAVIVLKQFVTTNNKKSPFSKKNVLLRDKFTCQYCKYKFDSNILQVDHVIPKSKPEKLPSGIKMNSFENTVTACFYCNSKKGNRTPKEAGMTLAKTPRPITRGQKIILEITSKSVPDEWKPYLESYLDVSKT